jgi:hypothetical protein
MDRARARGPPWTDGSTDRRRCSAAARSPEYGLRPLRCTKAHRRGRNRERGARGAWLGPHRSVGCSVVTGRRGGAVVVGEARWGGVPVCERRRVELGQVWNALGVVEVAFIGPGEGCKGGEGRVTAGEGGLQWPSNSAHYGGLRHDLKRGK